MTTAMVVYNIGGDGVVKAEVEVFLLGFSWVHAEEILFTSYSGGSPVRWWVELVTGDVGTWY